MVSTLLASFRSVRGKVMAEQDGKPLKAKWDKEGYNQWGTRYIYPRPCPDCGSDVPAGNMYGQSSVCAKCGKKLPNP